MGWFALFAEPVQVFHVGVDAIRLVACWRATVVVFVVVADDVAAAAAAAVVVAGRYGEDGCRGVWQCAKQDSKADQGRKHMDLRG